MDYDSKWKIDRKFAIRSIVLVSLLVILCVVVFLSFSRKQDKLLTVAFLDIGQGDAIFIQAPNGNQLLLDGGPDRSVLRELGTIMPLGDRSIDVVIASHPDADHISGLVDVVDNFKVNLFMEPGVGTDTKVYKTLENKIKTKKDAGEMKKVLARRGMNVDLGGGVLLEILYPNSEVVNWETNDASIVARLVYGETEFLLTGDAPFKTENALIYLDPSSESLRSDVLKVGHHGSKSSSSEKFVKAVAPDYAVISAGKTNRYGHPTEEVLNILKKVGVKVFRTDEVGKVVFRSDGKSLKLEAGSLR